VSSQLDVLKIVAAGFDSLNVPYMLTGSVAAGWYAQPRMTRDIDIVAVVYPLHAGPLVETFGGAFECDADTIRSAIEAGRPFNLIHRTALQKVDVIVRNDSDYELEKFDRRARMDVEGQAVWIIAPEDLILSKLVWVKQTRSELQLRDVRNIIAVQATLDWPYIHRWAARLTVAGFLAEVQP
jgi:hypothetical protein